MRAAYEGTRARSGQVKPYLSMKLERSPTEAEEASVFNPTARPANEIDAVDCWTLKKIPSVIIP